MQCAGDVLLNTLELKENALVCVVQLCLQYIFCGYMHVYSFAERSSFADVAVM